MLHKTPCLPALCRSIIPHTYPFTNDYTLPFVQHLINMPQLVQESNACSPQSNPPAKSICSTYAETSFDQNHHILATRSLTFAQIDEKSDRKHSANADKIIGKAPRRSGCTEGMPTCSWVSVQRTITSQTSLQPVLGSSETILPLKEVLPLFNPELRTWPPSSSRPQQGCAFPYIYPPPPRPPCENSMPLLSFA